LSDRAGKSLTPVDFEALEDELEKDHGMFTF